MGYNAYVKRVFPIPGRKAAAATAVVHGLFPAIDSRMTISSIRVKAGTGAGILAVLQVERVFKGSALVAGTLLAVPGFPADSANRTIGLRYPGGQTFFRTIASQAGDALTLSDSIEAEKGKELLNERQSHRQHIPNVGKQMFKQQLALVETLEKWIIDFENSLKEQN